LPAWAAIVGVKSSVGIGDNGMGWSDGMVGLHFRFVLDRVFSVRTPAVDVTHPGYSIPKLG
jgi:hypothetical protein